MIYWNFPPIFFTFGIINISLSCHHIPTPYPPPHHPPPLLFLSVFPPPSYPPPPLPPGSSAVCSQVVSVRLDCFFPPPPIYPPDQFPTLSFELVSLHPPTMTFDPAQHQPCPAQTAVPQVPESSTSRRKRIPSTDRRKRLTVQRRQASSVPDQAAIGPYTCSRCHPIFPPLPIVCLRNVATVMLCF